MAIPLGVVLNKVLPVNWDGNGRIGAYSSTPTAVATVPIKGFATDTVNGVLPEDLMILTLLMQSGNIAGVGQPFPSSSWEGSANPWTFLGSGGSGSGPKCLMWARKVPKQEAKQLSYWSVNLGSSVNWAMSCMVASNGYWREPIPIRSAGYSGPAGNIRYFPGVTPADVSATSTPPAGKPGGTAILSVITPFTNPQNNTLNGVPYGGSPTTGKLLPAGFGQASCAHHTYVYRIGQLNNGTPVALDGFNDPSASTQAPAGASTGPWGSGQTVETGVPYASMTIAIAPAPDLTYPPASRKASTVVSKFDTSGDLNQFTVVGSGGVSIVS